MSTQIDQSESGALHEEDLDQSGENNNSEDGDDDQLYPSGRKRHQRRCNNEIAKVHECPYFGCDKTYGSEGSLNLHMKIKHKAGSKTWREKFARDLVIAIREGAEVTDEQVHKMQYLPPGLIQSCALEIGFLDQFRADS
jgi:hypothetical protein